MSMDNINALNFTAHANSTIDLECFNHIPNLHCLVFKRLGKDQVQASAYIGDRIDQYSGIDYFMQEKTRKSDQCHPCDTIKSLTPSSLIQNNEASDLSTDSRLFKILYNECDKYIQQQHKSSLFFIGDASIGKTRALKWILAHLGEDRNHKVILIKNLQELEVFDKCTEPCIIIFDDIDLFGDRSNHLQMLHGSNESSTISLPNGKLITLNKNIIKVFIHNQSPCQQLNSALPSEYKQKYDLIDLGSIPLFELSDSSSVDLKRAEYLNQESGLYICDSDNLVTYPEVLADNDKDDNDTFIDDNNSEDLGYYTADEEAEEDLDYDTEDEILEDNNTLQPGKQPIFIRSNLMLG